jgi:hypothetical protein
MLLVDMVRGALDARGLDIRIIACACTHRGRVVQESSEWRVGNAFLLGTLQALLQNRHIDWARTPETDYLAEELLDYELHVDVNANDKYGAFTVGRHNDVVTAVGLSVLDDGHDRGVGFASAGEAWSRTPAEGLAFRAGQVRAAAANEAGARAAGDEDG